MATATIENLGSKEHVEVFKNSTIKIPGKGSIEMELYEASEFLGTHNPNGKPLRMTNRILDNDVKNVCQKCEKVFNTKDELLSHLQSHSDDVMKGQKEEQTTVDKFIFCCHICGDEFNNKSNLLKHMKTHKEDKDKQSQTPLTPQILEFEEVLVFSQMFDQEKRNGSIKLIRNNKSRI